MTTAVYPWNNTAFNMTALSRLNDRCDDSFAELNLDCSTEAELCEFARLSAIRREQELTMLAYVKQRLARNAADYEAQ
jgi:hypothetical protein